MQITSLNHLDQNFRLKRLYVSGAAPCDNPNPNPAAVDTCASPPPCADAGNKIATLKGSSLRYLNSLEVLLLANNQITDLKVQLREIQKLPCLQQLELIANPVAEETNYRAQLIHRCPNIHILDRHVVTDLERIEAAKLAKEFEWNKKPEAKMPEDIDLTLFREGQPMRLKKKGIHLAEAKLPRSWRKRPCFSRTFKPLQVRPAKWKPGVASQAEGDLDKVNAVILAQRRKQAFELEEEMFRATWWDSPGIGKVGPKDPMRASFQADAASGLHDESTAYMQSFVDDLKMTREHISYEHYPPWDPPKSRPEPLGKHLQKTKKVSVPKKKTNEAEGQPPRSKSSLTSDSEAPSGPDMTIQIDRKMFSSFNASRRAGSIKFGTGKYIL